MPRDLEFTALYSALLFDAAGQVVESAAAVVVAGGLLWSASDADEAAIDDDVSFLVQFVVDFEHTLRVYLFAMCAWISLISGYLGIFISAGICPATATFWYASWYVPSHVIFTSNVSTTLFGEFIYV